MEPHSSYAGLSDPDVPSGLMYNGAIAAKLREYFCKHSEAIHEHPEVDAKALNIAAMRTVADFQRAVIVTTHGFKDVDEYYEYFSPARIVPAIRTPTLYVVARDDPFLGQTAGIERPCASPSTSRWRTSRAAGTSRFSRRASASSASAGPSA